MADPAPSSKACAAPASETAPNDASQSKDVAAASESKKLPEWASFTGLIAAISIVAFTISRLYVVGIGFRLRQPVAVYFTPADYLQITPVWAIPYLAIICAYILFFWVLTAIAHSARLLSKPTLEKGVPCSRREADGGFWAKFPDWRTFTTIPMLPGIVVICVYLFGQFPHKAQIIRALSLTSLCPVVAAIFFACILTNQRNNPGFPIHGFVQKFIFVAVPFCLALAFSWGYFYEPVHIESFIPISKVLLVEIEKCKRVDGRVIFDLNRAVILLTPDSKQIVIPHEKIQEIETPKL